MKINSMQIDESWMRHSSTIGVAIYNALYRAGIQTYFTQNNDFTSAYWNVVDDYFFTTIDGTEIHEYQPD